MIDEHYPFSSREDKLLYYFYSNGPQGEILKIIIFQLSETGKWNLAFGDYEKEKIDDKIISNNNDLFKVMKTVVACTYDFSEKYPDRIIQVIPVDDKRNLLYHGILKRNLDIIEEKFWIDGLRNESIEPFDVQNHYQEFYFSRK
jgi:hypothetical protein